MSDRTCVDCGTALTDGPTIFSGGPDGCVMLWPERCAPCQRVYRRRRPERVYKAWKASRCTAREAADLTGITEEWFALCFRTGQACPGLDDALLDDHECGRATAKLLAVARERKRGVKQPTPFTRFPRKAQP